MKLKQIVSVLASAFVLTAGIAGTAAAADPATWGQGMPESGPVEQAPAPDIVTIAANDGRFTTLVTAVQAAGLVETLQSGGPFTVFAPTDEAFAKLPPGTVEALINDVPTLQSILLYHVVPGSVMASDVVNLSAAPTALGKDLSVRVVDGVVLINDAQVVITDIQASNGVIHVIDSVLLPPQE